MKREPTIYTLWVDGKAVKTFSREPPKDVRALIGTKGITITPPITERKKAKEQTKQLSLFSLFGDEK